jgi:uncharacterized membrane protein required for colicin V production
VVDLNEPYLIIGFIVLILFVLVGFRRGVLKELLTLVGVLLAIAVGEWAAPSLQPWVNRYYKAFMFSLKGGLAAEDPTSVFAEIDRLKPPITTDRDLLILGTAAFCLVLLVFYALGEAAINPPEKASERLLGAILAGMNGYFMAYFLVPRHLPMPKTTMTIRFSTRGMMDLLTQNVTVVALAFVIVLIVLGLQMSTGPKKPEE